MRTPNTFQIGSTTYTTREYCNARGITDNARILKIQWRINTYIRNHTIQQTIEELDRLTLQREHIKRVTHPAASWLDEQRQEKHHTNANDGIRPWQGAKKEREIAQLQREAREAATGKMITQQQNGETATKAIDQRELLKQSEWMENDTENPIENAIHQLAQALRNATRLTKELKENQKHIEHWKEITANLLNQETSNDRTKRYNRPEKVWTDT